ncbi:hypothetical protein GF367_03070 [Candidatus Woesearchaeota archaeon]|nr:hypothetical protein [Candidatus Woesearchaeota archaeon]
MKTTIFIMSALLLLSLLPLAAAEVVVFDEYDTTMDYQQGKLSVTKHLRLKNVGPNPIIPGEIHFKVSQERKGESSAPTIDSFSVVNKYNKELDTRQYASDTEVDLVFTVWDPLLPDFFYDMTMTYSLDFDPRGVLFYQVVLPEERTTIPISKATTTFNLPKRYHVTYLAPEGEVAAAKEVTSVTWKVKDSYAVEYSVVPFPRLGFKAVNVFWILIIILFLLNLFFRLKKKAQAARSL